MGFVDTMRSEGVAAESICRVLRGRGVQVTARTYRSGPVRSDGSRAGTVSDALVVESIGSIRTGPSGRLPLESLHRRRTVTALLRRRGPGFAHRLLPNGCVRPGPYVTGPLKDLTDVEMATMAGVDRWNHRRPHSGIGLLTAVGADDAHEGTSTALHPEPQRHESRDGSARSGVRPGPGRSRGVFARVPAGAYGRGHAPLSGH